VCNCEVCMVVYVDRGTYIQMDMNMHTYAYTVLKGDVVHKYVCISVVMCKHKYSCVYIRILVYS